MDRLELWRRYKQYLCECPSVKMSVDVSRMRFGSDFLGRMEDPMSRAYDAMSSLESGDIANPDEERMVGHYWLRAPGLAPNEQITDQIQATHQDVLGFAKDVHGKTIIPAAGGRFTDLVVIGIGGSALGPQLVADSLGTKRDKMRMHYVDNTDPDGIDRVVGALGARLKTTMVVVISKSGGTKETRNGMLEMQAAFEKAGLDFAKAAVAVTGEGSQLDAYAQEKGWLKRFPMWDWVGGRTSVMSAVGLVPAALQGIAVDLMLDGAAAMDEVTRGRKTLKNPAALLALSWYHATGGKGAKDMVVLPYKDRLLLLSRYLQQLVMESLGKEHDLAGDVVNQGIAVYGNKGSTDQHAYVQQLRDGVHNFFANFIVVSQDRSTPTLSKASLEVEQGVTSGDYLNGFWQGTREALFEKGRESVTITVQRLDAHALGALIALYERAVGLYAALVNINAYHQPGVEAGKKAAEAVLTVQSKVLGYLADHGEPATAEQIADRMGEPQLVETIHHVLAHLAANKRGVARSRNKFRLA